MKIKNTLIALTGSLLISCSTTPTNTENWMETKQNACLPTAIAFREGLRKYDVWSEVVLYRWYDFKSQTTKGHAIVAYMYPKGQNKLWTYDFWGSYRARAFKDNPLQIAREAVSARMENRDVNYAEFLK
jgi:hypothetical protein